MILTTILKWVLIASLSLVSTTAFMSFIDYDMFVKEVTYYFYYTQSTQMSDVILFGKIFKYLFPGIAPIFIFLLKRRYSSTVNFFAIALAGGCLGRWLSKTHYQSALASQSIVSFCAIPMIIAPFCLIPLLKSKQRAYAASIAIFFPLFGMKYVKDFNYIYLRQEVAPQEQMNLIYRSVQQLNKTIAILSLFGAILSVILMIILKQQIKQLTETKLLSGPAQAKFQQLSFLPKNNRFYCLFCMIGWGSLLGITWAHQQRYQIYYQKVMGRYIVVLMEKNLSIVAVIVSLLTYTVLKYFKISQFKIIYILNIFGLVGTILVELTSLKQQLHYPILITAGLAIIKIGFLGPILFVLEYLYKLGNSIFVSSIYVYFVYTVFIGCYHITQYIRDQVLCIGIMYFLSLLFVHMPYFIQPQYHKQISAGEPQVYPFKTSHTSKSTEL